MNLIKRLIIILVQSNGVVNNWALKRSLHVVIMKYESWQSQLHSQDHFVA